MSLVARSRLLRPALCHASRRTAATQSTSGRSRKEDKSSPTNDLAKLIASRSQAQDRKGIQNTFDNAKSQFLERLAKGQSTGGVVSVDDIELEPLSLHKIAARRANERAPRQKRAERGGRQMKEALDLPDPTRRRASETRSTGARDSLAERIRQLDIDSKVTREDGRSFPKAHMSPRARIDQVARRRQMADGGSTLGELDANTQYQQRHARRPQQQQQQPSTRFGMPRQPSTLGGPGGQRRPQREQKPRESREQRQSKAQQEADVLQDRLRRRGERVTPQPTAYDAPQLVFEHGVALDRSYAGEDVVYTAARTGADQDAPRLVHLNRSILAKTEVLEGISRWMPDVRA